MPPKPKPPTPARVSATLRAHDFRACRDGRDEGFQVEWSQGPGSAVRVGFEAVTTEIHDLAMRTMTTILQRKGWDVRDVGYLLVKEKP
jgi:hypothetical protein